MITRKVIETAARMFEIQTAAKQIFGASYPDKVKPWMELIVGMSQRLECSNAQAALSIANPNAGHGQALTDGDLLLLTAAVVELAESKNEMGRGA